MILYFENVWFLLRNDRKSIKKYTNQSQALQFIKNASIVAKKWKKGGWMRKSLAWHFKDLRTRFPYKAQDYSEAKKRYEEYSSLENSLISLRNFRSNLLKRRILQKIQKSKVVQSVFIYCFTSEVPIKDSKKFGAYHINYIWSTITVLECRIVDGEIQTRPFHGKWKKMQFVFDDEEGCIKQYLYATENQIAEFLDKRSRYNAIMAVKRELLEQLRQTSEQLNAIDVEIKLS